MQSTSDTPVFHGTTILSVRRRAPDGVQVAIGGDGQVTLGHIVVKGTTPGAQTATAKCWPVLPVPTADALTLFERFEAKLDDTGAPHARCH